MASGAETAFGAAAALKWLGLPALAGAIGAGLGFTVLWPTSKREAMARFTCAVLSSFVAGPFVAGWVHATYPTFFEAVVTVAVNGGHPREIGWLMAAGPCYVAAALPAWWLLGIIVRTLNHYRDRDARDAIRDIRDFM